MSEPEDQAPFGTNLGEAIEKKIEQVNELAPDQKEIASISEQLEKLIGDIQPDTNQAELESLKAILNDSEKRISMMKKQFPVDEKLANLRMRIVAAKIKLEQREKSIKDEVTPESETVRITNWLNILDRTISAVSSNQTLSETQILLGSASAAIETVLEKFPKEQERVGSLHNLLK